MFVQTLLKIRVQSATKLFLNNLKRLELEKQEKISNLM